MPQLIRLGCCVAVLCLATGPLAMSAEAMTADAAADASRVTAAAIRQAKADVATRANELADIEQSLASIGKRLDSLADDESKAKAALTEIEKSKTRLTDAKKRRDDADAKVAKQRRRATEASMKEQGDAQKAFNELSRELAGVDFDAQTAQAKARMGSIAKTREGLVKRQADIEAKRTAAAASLADSKHALEAASIAPEVKPAPNGDDIASP